MKHFGLLPRIIVAIVLGILLRQFYPGVQIVGNKKTFDMMRGFYQIEKGISLNNRLKIIGPSLSVRWFFSSQETVLFESNIGVYYLRKAPLCNPSDVYLPVKNRSFCNQFFGLSQKKAFWK